MSKYFENFPDILYNGQQVKNILAKANLTNQTRSNQSIFYPFTMKEDALRLDILSYKYYDNPDYAWLIYLTNNVIDPYYDMPLSQDDFNNFIIKKYGSIETAQKNIAYYRNAYENDESVLTIDEYESLNTLDKRYWNPTLDIIGNVYGYERKKVDWRVNTNRIVNVNVSGNTVFSINEYVYTDNSHGFVTFANTSVCSLQHVSGGFTANTVLSNNTVSTLIVSSNTIVENVTEVEEARYWNSVSFYDKEAELNAKKKEIYLIDNRYKDTISAELKASMS